MIESSEQIALDLDLSPITRISRAAALGIDGAFWEFHKANPHVYKNLEYLAKLAFVKGRNKIGIKFLFERIRWEYFIKTNHGEDLFRLNNNYTSRYARLIMKNNSDLVGFFDTREIRS